MNNMCAMIVCWLIILTMILSPIYINIYCCLIVPVIGVIILCTMIVYDMRGEHNYNIRHNRAYHRDIHLNGIGNNENHED